MHYLLTEAYPTEIRTQARSSLDMEGMLLPILFHEITMNGLSNSCTPTFTYESDFFLKC